MVKSRSVACAILLDVFKHNQTLAYFLQRQTQARRLSGSVVTFEEVVEHYLKTGPKANKLRLQTDTEDSSSEEEEAPKPKLSNGVAKPAKVSQKKPKKANRSDKDSSSKNKAPKKANALTSHKTAVKKATKPAPKKAESISEESSSESSPEEDSSSEDESYSQEGSPIIYLGPSSSSEDVSKKTESSSEESSDDSSSSEDEHLSDLSLEVLMLGPDDQKKIELTEKALAIKKRRALAYAIIYDYLWEQDRGLASAFHERAPADGLLDDSPTFNHILAHYLETGPKAHKLKLRTDGPGEYSSSSSSSGDGETFKPAEKAKMSVVGKSMQRDYTISPTPTITKRVPRRRRTFCPNDVGESSKCDIVGGECSQTYMPYLFLVILLGLTTLTGAIMYWWKAVVSAGKNMHLKVIKKPMQCLIYLHYVYK